MSKTVSCLAIAFFAFILWIIYLANTGAESVFFRLVNAVPHGDKIGHFFIFGILTLMANAGSGFRCTRFLRLRFYWGTLAVSIFVLLEELSQGFLPTRTMDLRDLIADGCGILFFTAVSLGWDRRSKQVRP